LPVRACRDRWRVFDAGRWSSLQLNQTHVEPWDSGDKRDQPNSRHDANHQRKLNRPAIVLREMVSRRALALHYPPSDLERDFSNFYRG
jgi:hypothetical protein